MSICYPAGDGTGRYLSTSAVSWGLCCAENPPLSLDLSRELCFRSSYLRKGLGGRGHAMDLMAMGGPHCEMLERKFPGGDGQGEDDVERG